MSPAATLFAKEFHFYGNQFSGSKSPETMLHYSLLELKRKNVELKKMNFFLLLTFEEFKSTWNENVLFQSHLLYFAS